MLLDAFALNTFGLIQCKKLSDYSLRSKLSSAGAFYKTTNATGQQNHVAWEIYMQMQLAQSLLRLRRIAEVASFMKDPQSSCNRDVSIST